MTSGLWEDTKPLTTEEENSSKHHGSQQSQLRGLVLGGGWGCPAPSRVVTYTETFSHILHCPLRKLCLNDKKIL